MPPEESHKTFDQTYLNKIHDRQSWLGFFSFLLLCGGLAFSVFGIIFFFAFNWNALPHIAKLSVPLSVFVLLTLIQLLIKAGLLIRQSIAFFQIILIGSFLAVFGQVYQTGADSYELFQGWFLLSLPLVLLYNSSAIWLLSLLLFNLALQLFIEQTVDYTVSSLWLLPLSASCTIMLVALVCYEILYAKAKSVRWFGYVIFIFTLAILTAATISIIDHPKSYHVALRYVFPTLYILFSIFYFYYSYSKKQSLVEPALICISVMLVIFFITDEFIQDSISLALVIAVEFILLSFLSTKLLLGMKKRLL